MGKIYKILFCCGSRPELIKISPVYHRLKSASEITPILCTTGQHRDLLTAHLDYLRIKPDYQLDVLREGQTLEQLMAQLFDQMPWPTAKFYFAVGHGLN